MRAFQLNTADALSDGSDILQYRVDFLINYSILTINREFVFIFKMMKLYATRCRKTMKNYDRKYKIYLSNCYL